MKAGIITIGDELLIGQTINSNAAWIGQVLSNQGVDLYRSVTIRDDREDILSVVDEYMQQADFIIVTGGLGPTNDDITKETLAEYFQMELELHEQVLHNIEQFFAQRGKEILPKNKAQAELPKDALILDNQHGTAAGMWFERKDKVLVSLPGVPYEMKAIMEDEVIPRLKSKFGVAGNYYQTLMTQGVGESFLAEQIEDWEKRIYADGLSLAYLPSPGLVRLRVTSKNGRDDAPLIQRYLGELQKKIPQYVYGMNDDSIFEVVGDLLRSKNSTLGTVESCSGGGIANRFVQQSGASDYFLGGLVTYSNKLKKQLAGVQEATLEKYGAVSEATVREMAAGGQSRLDVDYVIAVSGVAGPSGGTKEKPVGTVWIAIAHPEGIEAQKFLFGNHRGRNLEKTELYATNMLRKIVMRIE